MTVLEAKSQYGVQYYVTSVGESLTSVVRKCYSREQEKGELVIKSLNFRFDWDGIAPASSIEYISEAFISNIDEV